MTHVVLVYILKDNVCESTLLKYYMNVRYKYEYMYTYTHEKYIYTYNLQTHTYSLFLELTNSVSIKGRNLNRTLVCSDLL
jgi:hypothetical protein